MAPRVTQGIHLGIKEETELDLTGWGLLFIGAAETIGDPAGISIYYHRSRRRNLLSNNFIETK
jgi:hypothetical protein